MWKLNLNKYKNVLVYKKNENKTSSFFKKKLNINYSTLVYNKAIALELKINTNDEIENATINQPT